MTVFYCRKKVVTIIEFIVHYWIQTLFGLIIAFVGYLFRLLKKWKQEQDALKSGVLAMLHDRLFQSCSYYIEQEFIPLNRYEEVHDNVKMLYDTYHTLGGNGTGTSIYEKFDALPVKAVEKKGESLWIGKEN